MPSTPKSSATSHLTTNDDAPTVALSEAMEVLLWFGALMMRAGNTAARTREWIEVLTRKMGFEDVSVSFSLDSIAASVRCGGKRVTTMREIEPPGINAWRIAELEQLARTVGPRPAPRDVAARLAKIESTVPRYSSVPIATAVGAASAGFAFLNGAGTREMIAAAIGGGIGQWLRLWMSHRQLNQYGAAALSAIAASGIYVLVAALARYAGLGFAHYPAGFIASVLFLIPGFPLIAGLFDLLQYQTVAAVSRLAYGVMILLVVAFGLSIVVELAGIDLSRQPPLELVYPLKLLLRAVASFVAGAAFAMLFNSPPRMILAAGALALGANSLRLVLNDMGMMLAPASFFAALAIGLVAVLVDTRLNVPRMAMIVAPTVIMMPGLYAFEMIVLFNRGKMLDALQASASCAFIVGALAMGLATARFFNKQ
jgi:uncharacterized membrane protein YjjP (DUF1212 family)